MIRQRILAGESPEQIRAWLISRYGNWVSYDPPLEPATWPLWAAPALLLARRLWLAAAASGGGGADGLAAIIIALAAPTLAASGSSRVATRARCNSSAPRLLLALAGYAWQGQPGLAGRPKAPPERQQLPDSEFAETRERR